MRLFFKTMSVFKFLKLLEIFL